MDFTAAVHVTTSGQISLGHGESWPGGETVHRSSLHFST